MQIYIKNTSSKKQLIFNSYPVAFLSKLLCSTLRGCCDLTKPLGPPSWHDNALTNPLRDAAINTPNFLNMLYIFIFYKGASGASETLF